MTDNQKSLEMTISDAHAAIDASPAKIIRNAMNGYPGGQEPRELTLVERIRALSLYADDWKRWCLEAEAKVARASRNEPSLDDLRRSLSWPADVPEVSGTIPAKRAGPNV